jgi:predicted lipid-binding transport protein (Tim44 family)
MNKTTGMVISALLAFTLALTGSEAFAARMGGGKSFGSRPSYSTPYQRSPSAAQPGMGQPGMGQPGMGQPGMSQPGMGQPGMAARQPAYSAAQQRNQSIRDSLAQRGGFMRMLGGLALGGLLGAMLFGGGFEGINFLDILMFGLIAFMLFKLFAARRRASEGVATPAGYYPGNHDADPVERPYQRQGYEAPTGRAGFDTDILSRKGGAPASGFDRPAAPVFPADFDAAAFLNGAKAAYTMMQKAWDEGDLAELRALTTDKVFGELQDQIRARGGAANHTELLKVEAEILEVQDVGPDREVAVLFDVLLREAPGSAPAQVREVWHFTRSRNSRQPTWFLDGIQQVED